MKHPGKLRGQYYFSHQTTDTGCGIITGVTVTPGDVYDLVPHLKQLEHIHQNVIPIQAAAADSAYDFPWPTWCWRSMASLSLSSLSLPMTVPMWS